MQPSTFSSTKTITHAFTDLCNNKPIRRLSHTLWTLQGIRYCLRFMFGVLIWELKHEPYRLAPSRSIQRCTLKGVYQFVQMPNAELRSKFGVTSAVERLVLRKAWRLTFYHKLLLPA